ncbi:MAG TPA: hypothetical protein VHM27_09195 [Rhizomicrobium sp.]|jgi:hypothetical protein|nr:hypothetical protein [Rhizomicrobium sp.]
MRRLLVCLVMLAAPTTAFAAPSESGIWFGHGQPGDQLAMYLDQLRPNGDFLVHHRTCIKGKTLDQFASGHWSAAGNMVTINIQTVNGRSEPRTDVYRTQSVDAKTWRYTYLPTNFAYSAQRVAENFKMPSCELVS